MSRSFSFLLFQLLVKSCDRLSNLFPWLLSFLQALRSFPRLFVQLHMLCVCFLFVLGVASWAVGCVGGNERLGWLRVTNILYFSVRPRVSFFHSRVPSHSWWMRLRHFFTCFFFIAHSFNNNSSCLSTRTGGMTFVKCYVNYRWQVGRFHLEYTIFLQYSTFSWWLLRVAFFSTFFGAFIKQRNYDRCTITWGNQWACGRLGFIGKLLMCVNISRFDRLGQFPATQPASCMYQ